MLLGLIFRESAKEKRSISAWRSDAKGILPTSRDHRPVFVNASPSFVASTFAGTKRPNQLRHLALSGAPTRLHSGSVDRARKLPG